MPFKTEDSTQFCYKHKLDVAELKNGLPCSAAAFTKCPLQETSRFSWHLLYL